MMTNPEQPMTAQPDNVDICLACAKKIPPGPDFCSNLCEIAHTLAQTLHDLYGHTFDLVGFEAIRYALEAYHSAASRVGPSAPTSSRLEQSCPICGSTDRSVVKSKCLALPYPHEHAWHSAVSPVEPSAPVCENCDHLRSELANVTRELRLEREMSVCDKLDRERKTKRHWQERAQLAEKMLAQASPVPPAARYHSTECANPTCNGTCLKAESMPPSEPVTPGTPASLERRCIHCHVPVVTLDGTLVHKATLRDKCPTAGNLSGRTNTKAEAPVPAPPSPCQDCAANDRDWKQVADELGCESTREEILKTIRKLQAEAAPPVAPRWIPEELIRLHHKWVNDDDLSHEEVQAKMRELFGLPPTDDDETMREE